MTPYIDLIFNLKQINVDQILWTTFEAAVITKNKVVESLLKDLEDAEVQYSMMLQNHVQVVDKLIGKFNCVFTHQQHGNGLMYHT